MVGAGPLDMLRIYQFCYSMTIENIVAEDERRRPSFHVFRPDNVGLGQCNPSNTEEERFIDASSTSSQAMRCELSVQAGSLCYAAFREKIDCSIADWFNAYCFQRLGQKSSLNCPEEGAIFFFPAYQVCPCYDKTDGVG